MTGLYTPATGLMTMAELQRVIDITYMRTRRLRIQRHRRTFDSVRRTTSPTLVTSFSDEVCLHTRQPACPLLVFIALAPANTLFHFLCPSDSSM